MPRFIIVRAVMRPPNELKASVIGVGVSSARPPAMTSDEARKPSVRPSSSADISAGRDVLVISSGVESALF
jgi:hypothetical protein